MEKLLYVGEIEQSTRDYLTKNCELCIAPDYKEETIAALIGQGMKAVILRGFRITDNIIRAGKELKVIARAAAGYDEVNLDICREMGIYVCNAPGGNANATAEMTIALAFALARQIVPLHNDYLSGRFNVPGKTVLQMRTEYGYLGHELAKSTYGVLGYGRIGKLVVQKALGLGMNVIVYDPFLCGRTELPEGASWGETLEDILPECDFVSLHMPSSKSTVGIINRETLGLMKRTAYIINEARGDIIDEADMAEALNNGTIAGAALDCNTKEPLPMDHIYRSCKNIILTPHTGGFTAEANVNIEMLAAVSAIQGINGLVPDNCVNLNDINGKK